MLVSTHLPLVLTVTRLKRGFILIKRNLLFLFLFLIIGVAVTLFPDRISLLLLFFLNKDILLYPAALIAERRDKGIVILSLPTEVSAIIRVPIQRRVEALNLLLRHHGLAVRALHFILCV